jgi:thiamine kinase
MAQALPDPVRDACRRAFLAGDQWAPAETQAPRVVSVLGGGLSNVTLLLAGAERRWVLRVPLAPPGPGVHRGREFALHDHAARAGLAPPILYFEEPTGTMITPWLEADVKPQSIDAIARLLRGIHGLEAPAVADDAAPEGEVLNSAVRLQRWRGLLGDRDPLESLSRAATNALKHARQRVRAGLFTPRICHNDLLTANRLTVANGQLKAIDWEYASLGDPFFDLAAVASELAPMQRGTLLATYLARPPTAAETQRFGDQQLLYLAIAACWHAAAGADEKLRQGAIAALEAACAEGPA